MTQTSVLFDSLTEDKACNSDKFLWSLCHLTHNKWNTSLGILSVILLAMWNKTKVKKPRVELVLKKFSAFL